MIEERTSAKSCLSPKVNDWIISDPHDVCIAINKYFFDVAENISHGILVEDNEDNNTTVSSYEYHQSISGIEIIDPARRLLPFVRNPRVMSGLVTGLDSQKRGLSTILFQQVAKIRQRRILSITFIVLLFLFNESLKTYSFSDVIFSKLATMQKK